MITVCHFGKSLLFMENQKSCFVIIYLRFMEFLFPSLEVPNLNLCVTPKIYASKGNFKDLHFLMEISLTVTFIVNKEH